MRVVFRSLGAGERALLVNLFDVMLFTFQYTEVAQTETVETDLGPLYGVERETVKGMCGTYIYSKYFGEKFLRAVEAVEGRGEVVEAELPPVVPDTTPGVARRKHTAAEEAAEEMNEAVETVDTDASDTITSSGSSLTSTYVLAGAVVNGEYIPTAPSTVKLLPLYQLGLVRSRKVLGKGAFGEVSKVMTLAEGSGVIKKLARSDAAMAIRQAEILKMMKHDNIILLGGCYFDSEFFVLFFNTCCPTKLHNVVQDSKMKTALVEIALAVDYIHSMKVVHRDIKPCNIMLDEAGRAKLLDFGIAKVVPDRTFTSCGSEGYMAPEIGSDDGYTQSVDVYALAKTADNMLFYNGDEWFDDIFDNPATRPSILQLRDMLWNHPVKK